MEHLALYYKDIGFQGTVCVPFLSWPSWSRLTELSVCSHRYADVGAPCMRPFGDFLTKKKRLAAGKLGADVSAVANIFDPLLEWLRSEVRKYLAWSMTLAPISCTAILVDTRKQKAVSSSLEPPTAHCTQQEYLLVLLEWSLTHHIQSRVVRNILLSEELYPEYAERKCDHIFPG